MGSNTKKAELSMEGQGQGAPRGDPQTNHAPLPTDDPSFKTFANFTEQLRTAAEVAKQISAILDPDLLLHKAVALLQSSFALAHISIYILDEPNHRLIARAGSTGAGNELVETGYAISLDEEHSVVAQVAQTQVAMLVEDMQALPEFTAPAPWAATRAEIAIPLVSRKTLLGVLDIHDDHPQRFTQTDLDVFSTLAGQLATAMENAALFLQVEQNLEETRLRFWISQKLAEAKTEEEVLSVIITQAGLYANARVALYLFEATSANRTLVLRKADSFQSGLMTLPIGFQLPLEHWPLSRHISPTESLVSANVLTDTRLDERSRAVAQATGAMSFAIVPLMAGLDWLGILSASSSVEGYFDERVVRLYQTLAEQGAIALRDVRQRATLEQTRAEAEQERALLNNILANLPLAGVLVVDRELEVLRANTLAQQFLQPFAFQAPASEQPGKTREVVHAFTGEPYQIEHLSLKNTMETGQTEWVDDIAIRQSDGTLTYFLGNTGPLRNRKGEIIGAMVCFIDISARRKAEKEQELLAERIRLLLESTDEGIFGIDPEGACTFVNRAAAQMLGYEPSVLMGQNMHALICRPEEGAAPSGVPQFLSHTFYTEQGVHVDDAPFWRQDGSAFSVEFSAYPMLEGGQVTGSVVTFRDITARKEAEEALRASESRYRMLLDQAADGIFLADRQGRHVLVNRRACELLGYTHEELMAIPIRNAFLAEELAANPLRFHELLPGKSLLTQRTMVRKDGSHFPAEIGGTMLESGHLQAIVRDITDRKRAEEERVRLINQLRTASELTEELNSILDPERLLQATVTRIHERLDLYHSQVYLLDETQTMLVIQAGSGEVGQVMGAEKHAIPINHAQSIVARAARTQDPVLVEDTLNAPYFLPHRLLPDTRSEVAVPLLAGGQLLGVLDVQASATHHFNEADVDVLSTLANHIATSLQNARRYVEVQQTAERLRELDRLKSEFLANMSHELRTPLNSIIGYSELMLLGANGTMDDESLEDVKAIRDNGHHLLNLINDILDLAKIEAGRMQLELEHIEVGGLMDGIKVSTSSLFRTKPVQLIIEVAPHFPALYGDRLRLTQVLMNLVSNAIKFTDQGYIKIRAFHEGEFASIEVKDTGIGINENHLETIFEKFRQVDGSYTRRAAGTGLGLAITRSIIELHGGTIDVQSQPGQGSTFTISIPIVAKQPDD